MQTIMFNKIIIYYKLVNNSTVISSIVEVCFGSLNDIGTQINISIY